MAIRKELVGTIFKDGYSPTYLREKTHKIDNVSKIIQSYEDLLDQYDKHEITKKDLLRAISDFRIQQIALVIKNLESHEETILMSSYEVTSNHIVTNYDDEKILSLDENSKIVRVNTDLSKKWSNIMDSLEKIDTGEVKIDERVVKQLLLNENNKDFYAKLARNNDTRE